MAAGGGRLSSKAAECRWAAGRCPPVESTAQEPVRGSNRYQPRPSCVAQRSAAHLLPPPGPSAPRGRRRRLPPPRRPGPPAQRRRRPARRPAPAREGDAHGKLGRKSGAWGRPCMAASDAAGPRPQRTAASKQLPSTHQPAGQRVRHEGMGMTRQEAPVLGRVGAQVAHQLQGNRREGGWAAARPVGRPTRRSQGYLSSGRPRQQLLLHAPGRARPVCARAPPAPRRLQTEAEQPLACCWRGERDGWRRRQLLCSRAGRGAAACRGHAALRHTHLTRGIGTGRTAGTSSV